MSDLKYWLAFAKIYSIGTIHLRKMLDHFGNIEASWLAAPAELQRIEGFSAGVIEKFSAERNALQCLDCLEETVVNKDIQVITLEDENYPFYLKQIYDPPVALFIKGSLDRLNEHRSLAIVGSRKASHYIKEVLKKLIAEFKGTDVTIISGMAVGVDACAHQSALDNGLNTIAVIGSGLDHIYPKQNKELFKKIIDAGGAVITEYFPDKMASPMTFPRRNRIISGLSQGTLVGEAGLKSGALITARLCLDHNRELMCIPGMVTNPNTEGTYKLIKEGAAVVTKAEDILNQLNWEIKTGIQTDYSKNTDPAFENSKEKVIYDLLDLEPKSFDTILAEAKMGIDELMLALTSLELDGTIKQLPGQQFVRNL